MHALHVGMVVFGVIFMAELPDKTAIASVVLATRHKPLPVFLGAALALVLQSFIAVAAGSLFSLLPPRPVHVGAGILFIVSGLLMGLRHEPEKPPVSDEVNRSPPSSGPSFGRALVGAFGIVFVAEWGDLTQLATAGFAARERAPVVVFAAATLAMWAVTALAVGVGHRAAQWLHPDILQRLAAALFVGVGVALIAGWL